MIKLRSWRLFWSIEVGPTESQGSLEEEDQTQKKRRDNKSRGWNDDISGRGP